ncbi:hypothetical protein D6853_13300 [Butyrivibrio sp. X503]|uniref:glycoside hydrolase family 25 protein n=1 Tax=Butyrivibrio sp. X503 TaxID=2364878 RepID=UPI000EA99DA8|nr:GH25 family lysozyme [Butyrivibrio sp. X503]RKM54497.1 hypothetical protein D6853_13300 [Butyrivibrio sp. X503]
MKKKKFGLFAGKKSGARRREKVTKFKDYRDSYYENDDFDEDFEDDYDSDDYDRDYAEDDGYYRDDYDDVDRDYEDDARYDDDRYDDDEDGDYRDDTDADYRDDDDADYRDDERYSDEDDENYSDEDVEEERYEDDADSEDERYSDDEDYRDEDDRYADEDDTRYEDDARYDEEGENYDEARYADEEGDRYEDDVDYRDEDDRYADEDDTRYDEEDDRYADEEEDRYADDVDYREDARYADEEENYADEEDENYDDEDYRDDYYEDDYDYERYDDDDRYASASARRNKGGAFAGKSSKSKRLKSSKKSAKNSRKNSKKNKKNRDDNDNIFARFLTFVKGTSAVERTAAAVGIVILAGVIVTVSFFSTALDRNKELNSFADVGSNMDDTQVIGQSGLIAVADAEKARSLTAEMVDEEDDDEAAEPETESAKINMSLTTIKSDMKIKFFNAKTNKLVASVPFKVDVVTPDGSKTTFEDDDKDGIIYKKELKAGKYTVTPVALTDEYSEYELDTSSKTLTVKDTVEMKAVDVSNEIKKESQVNAAKEDTAVQTQVESVLKDTVEWVESTKTPIGDGEGDGGDYTYEEIDNNSIKNPIAFSRNFAPGTFVKTALFTADNSTLENSNGEKASDSASNSSTVKPETDDDNGENSGDTPSTGNQGGDNNQTANPGNQQQNSGDNTSSGSGDNTSSGSSNNNGSQNQNGGQEQTPQPPKEKKMDFNNHSLGASIEIEVDQKSFAILPEDADTHQQISGVSFSVEKTNVAKVVDGNKIQGVSAGNTKVTLSKDGYNSISIPITVKDKPQPKEFWIEPANVVLTVGDKKPVYVKDKSGTLISGGVTFSPDKPDVAKIDESKNIVALKKGQSIITVTCNGYNPGKIVVEVNDAAPKKMKLNIEDGIKLKVNSVTNSITAVDESDGKTKVNIKSITVRNEDKNVLEIVDGNKVKVKAKGSGVAYVNVAADGYETKTLKINIEGTGGKIPLKISKMTLMEGKKVSPAASELVKDDNIKKIKLTSDNPNVAKIEGDSSIVPVAKGEANITVTADGYEPSDKIKVTVLAKKDPLTDKDGNPLYMKNSDGKFVEATLADYDPNKKFYTRKNGKQEYKYTGWQTIDGKTYFFKKDHEYVTGEQVIQGAKYTFGADGVLSSGSGSRGIDVSKWNGSIDWKKVKNEGIDFAIIRCGYRGSSAGALIEDPTFRANMKGAQAAGIKVGVYFFTQAVNEVEAVEEASMVINLCKGYGLSYPVYLDVEGSNGRGDGISAAQRTANIKAFCGTIQNAGYKAGVYANKTWFTSKINTSQLTNYKIWLAQYAASPTYNATRYDMWQYTSKGKVSGISGNVDMNTWYR